MPRTPWRIVLLTAGLVAAPAYAGDGFAPGQWRHETDLVSADVPGIPQWLIRIVAGRGSRQSCNGAAELRSHPESLLKGDDDAICKPRSFSMVNGRLLFDTFCTNARFPDGLLVSSHGSYTPTSYAISTISTGTRNGKPVRIVTTGSGHRVADSCTKS